MRKQRRFLCMMLVMLLAGLAGGCGVRDTSGGKLTVCADGNGLSEMYLGPILAEFQKSHPGTALEVVYLPPVNTQDSAMTEERAAALARTRTELMGGEGADIYLFFNRPSEDYDSYMLFPNLERQIMGGVFHDLDFLFEHSEFEGKAYVAPLQEAGIYEGKPYILPLSYTCPAMIATADGLADSGFDEAAAMAGTDGYVEELLSLPKETRPYLNVSLPSLLMNAPSESPVSVQEAKIRLDTPAWQDTLEQARLVLADYDGSEDDFFAAVNTDMCLQEGAVILAGAALDTGYSLRALEDGGQTARLLPIPNEKGGLTMTPCITAAVSAGCKNTGAAAELLLFLLGDTVQGSGVLESSGSAANFICGGTSWPVRRGCAAKMLEQLSVQPVQPGEISGVLKTDLQNMEERLDVCRLAGRYDGRLYLLAEPYLSGETSWEACYAGIEKEWSYLDE